MQARPGESASEREARLQREMMRRERKREREREMRQETLGKKTKTMRDRDRDITEKIALGMHTSGKLSGEAMFDQRLFNQVLLTLYCGLLYISCMLRPLHVYLAAPQSTGIDAGFKDEEDDDNVYTKAFQREAAPVCEQYGVDVCESLSLYLLELLRCVVLVLVAQAYRPRAFDDSGAKL